ncbi:hypothetical protein HYW87_00955 [Candidatus Roizmanbacteria bacterium]|nr:hypothetical protein [Candidatus Roizmanbacteria bacterium]
MKKDAQKISSHPPSNFWFGFALGALAIGGMTFLLGTVKGRKTLQRLLEVSENLEENILLLGEEVEEALLEPAKNHTPLSPQKSETSTLGKILDKIKIHYPAHVNKQGKKYFIKNSA